MLYLPETRAESEALNTAADRQSVRRVARGIYTDDFDRPPEVIVKENLLAIIGRTYPAWHISHSTAATLRPVNGVAFISGHGRRAPTKFPGVLIKRLHTVPYPEVATLQLDTLVARGLRAEPTSAIVQLSSPLQTVFEVLSRDARQPERSLPDEIVRTLIESLSKDDLARAAAFATRNRLTKEHARFQRIFEGLSRARSNPIRRSEGLDLYFYNWRVGRLEALPLREFRFDYDPDWRIPLSGLPPDRSPAYEGRELPPFFDNLLPEGWAEARLRAAHKIAREDTFGLLKTTQKYLSNLTLRPDGFDASDVVLDHVGIRLEHQAPDSARVLALRDDIGKNPDTNELWIELRRRGATRLSGVQSKLPVHVEVKGGGLILTLGDLVTPTTHILKLPSYEFPELVANEWAVMELARRIGLPIPSVRRVSFQGESPLSSPALLVERFDLPSSIEDPTELLLVEDAASLLGIRRDDKYRTSHERVLEAVRAAGVPQEDLVTCFDHVAYSWIVGNGDLHEKNISVAHYIAPGHFGSAPSKKGVRYAPFYDLVCTRLVIRDDLFALTLNGKRNNIRMRDFAAFARRWGWTRAEATERIAGLGERIRANLDDVVQSSGLTQRSQARLVELVTTNVQAALG